jgi:hypothetical protein
VLETFIRDRKVKNDISNATINRGAQGGSADIECRASRPAMAQRAAEDSDAERTPPATSFLETRGGWPID